MLTGFNRADTIASLVVVALMARGGARPAPRVRPGPDQRRAPAGHDHDAVADRLLRVRDVVEVHDLHLRMITSGQPTLSAHVLVTDGADCHGAREEHQRVLAHDYRIGHTTLEVDHDKTHAGVGHCAEAHGATRFGDAQHHS